ncbi:hypothetical protein D3C77_633250 [compost metagenome]
MIQYAVSWVETKLFGDSVNSGPISIVGFEGTTGMNSDGGSAEIATEALRFPWDTFIFELCIIGLMVWAITYLINKRVEV